MPREIHSGERVFRVALPQPVQPPDEEREAELPQPVEPSNLEVPLDEAGPVVTIYVRRGDHAKERTISINPIPDGVDPLLLLEAGFAIDGNSATISADPVTFVYDDDAKAGHIGRIRRLAPGTHVPEEWAATWSLTKAVNSIERTLVNWLHAQGYQVKFG